MTENNVALASFTFSSYVDVFSLLSELVSSLQIRLRVIRDV